jgi:hypothetical protein
MDAGVIQGEGGGGVSGYVCKPGSFLSATTEVFSAKDDPLISSGVTIGNGTSEDLAAEALSVGANEAVGVSSIVKAMIGVEMGNKDGKRGNGGEKGEGGEGGEGREEGEGGVGGLGDEGGQGTTGGDEDMAGGRRSGGEGPPRFVESVQISQTEDVAGAAHNVVVGNGDKGATCGGDAVAAEVSIDGESNPCIAADQVVAAAAAGASGELVGSVAQVTVAREEAQEGEGVLAGEERGQGAEAEHTVMDVEEKHSEKM